jgi:hypothetical protein
MTKYKPFLHRQPRRYMQRHVDEIPVRQRFLIYCEGEKTEPNYFHGFRAPSLIVKVEGLRKNTLSLVQRVIELRAAEEGEYDQTWCVFDKDDFPDDKFNQAISLARRNGMKVAYSNQSFELWYVLHFSYMRSAITRSDYMRILDEQLGHKYEKNSTGIYDELHDFQTVAIRNARRLLDQYHPSRPAKDDPSTTVHLLVEQLAEFSISYKTGLINL